MNAIDQLRRLRAHAAWADDLLLAAIRRHAAPPADALREWAHVLGADETWLARIEGRPPRLPVWPEPDLDALAPLAGSIRAGYDRLLDGLAEERLGNTVHYANSAGQSFDTPLGDILLHAALHAQYHRGKINLLLRREGEGPVAADYIVWARGAPRRVATASSE